MALVEAKGKLVTVVGFGPTGEIVPISFDADGKLITSGGGVSTFIALTDVDEADYIGHAGQLVRVNATPDGLEFVDGAWTTRNAHVKLTGVQDVVTSTTTKVLLNSEDFDPASDYDLPNSKYICAEAGVYLVNCGVMYTAEDVEANARVMILIRKNGSNVSGSQTHTAVADKFFGVTHGDIVTLAVDDYVELFTWHDFGANAILYATGGYTFMSFVRVA